MLVSVREGSPSCVFFHHRNSLLSQLGGVLGLAVALNFEVSIPIYADFPTNPNFSKDSNKPQDTPVSEKKTYRLIGLVYLHVLNTFFSTHFREDEPLIFTFFSAFREDELLIKCVSFWMYFLIPPVKSIHQTNYLLCDEQWPKPWLMAVYRG